MSEDEEFEFRQRMEQEAETAVQHQDVPSLLSVAGNAAWKGLASIPDFALNAAGSVGNALMPPRLRPGAMQNPMQTGMESAGLIRPENEPQTAGQRVLDTGIRAGVNMLVNPVKGGVQAAANVAQGLTSGALAQITKEATGSDLLAMAVGLLAPYSMSRAASSSGNVIQTPVGTATFKDAQEAGYVVQPSTVRPSMATNRLESVAGKAAVAQDAALRNQVVTNQLAAKSIGIPEKDSITMLDIEQVRAEAGKVYQEVADISPAAAKTLEKLKQARADTTAQFRYYERSADPKALKEAKALQARSTALETTLEQTTNDPALIARLRAARTLIARTHDVERALNLGDGNVSASTIGRMLDKGHPLSGDLKVIGKFAQAFPRVARDASSVPPPGSSGTDAFSSAVLGGIGYGAAGGPAGLVAAGLPLLRSPARNLVLSGKYQSRLLKEPTPMSDSLLKGALVGKSLSDYQEAVP